LGFLAFMRPTAACVEVRKDERRRRRHGSTLGCANCVRFLNMVCLKVVRHVAALSDRVQGAQGHEVSGAILHGARALRERGVLLEHGRRRVKG
jgi:hypothetical protein